MSDYVQRFPPPTRPAMDQNVRRLQGLIEPMTMSLNEVRQGREIPFPQELRAALSAVQAPIMAKLVSQDLERRWAQYDAFPVDADAGQDIHPGDLLYLRGDVIEVVEWTNEYWGLGRCRGRLGVFPLEHTVPGPFVMALYNYTATYEEEISFRKGEVMPATSGRYEAGYTVFRNGQKGECLRPLFAKISHLPSAEEIRNNPTKYYQYSQLLRGQIRLIYITPRDVEQFISCNKQSLFVTICHTNLEDIQKATALSYCWGNSSDKRPIFADGKLLYIPSALWRTLRRQYPQSGISTYTLGSEIDKRESPGGQAIFWADAVCINQEDTLEKNHQIPLMSNIYGNARLVLVYVGEGIDHAEAGLVMSIIIQTAEQFSPWTVVPDRVIRGKMKTMPWNPVRGFLTEPVFLRSWVIQEIVLAKHLTICYGWMHFNLNQILDCVKAIKINHVRHVDSLLGVPEWTRGHGENFRKATNQLYNLASIKSRHRDGNMTNFLEILESFRHSNATDPRDKVYSVLSLASEPYRSSIVPDYSPSNTVASTFLSLARRAIIEGDIELLLRNAGGIQTVSGLPSWAPDWTYDSRSIIPSDQFACCGIEQRCRASLSETTSQLELTIRGSLFQKITRTSPALDSVGHDNIPDMFGTLTVAIQVVHHLFNMAYYTASIFDGEYPNGDDLLVAIWQTLVCGLGWNDRRIKHSDIRHFEAFLRCYQGQLHEMLVSGGLIFPLSWGTRLVNDGAELNALIREIGPGTTARILMNEQVPQQSLEQEQRAELEEELYPFLATMIHHQAERRACMTEKGYFGTIPREAQEGDLIVIFFGVRVPFVLRPLAGGTYKLIGPCYVHGIMDGEAIQSNDRDLCETKEVNFVLA